MSSTTPGNPGRPSRPRPTLPTGRSRALLPAVIVLIALLLGFWQFTEFYTDWLWFGSVDFTSVLRTEVITKSLLFVVFGGLLAATVAVNFVVAYRTRPVYALVSPEQQSLERYRSSIAPYRRWLAAGPAVLLGLLAGASAAGQWRTYLLWRNGTDFGQTDPQFGKDVGFFTFDLPWYRFLLGFLFTALILSLLVAAATHYLYGGLRLQGTGERTTAAARVHLSVLLGLFVLAKAVAYWLDRYNLAVLDNGRSIGSNPFTGLKYTDVHAVLVGKYALAGIAAICALLFFLNILRRTWLLPGIGVGLLLVSAVVVGGLLPALVQWVQVRPSEAVKEAPYIERNIQATREAYGIADAEITPYAPPEGSTPATVVQQAKNLEGVRVLDPYVVPPTFRQKQQVRQYYRFPQLLDVDRYKINGQETEVVLGVRELDLNQSQTAAQRNWINDHLVYTHGYGVVAAQSDTSEADGSPKFIERDVPETGQLTDLGAYEPRIYFGEFSPDYSIVGGSKDDPRELDYPVAQGQQNTSYEGSGGVAVGSFFRKTLYAVKFQEEKIFLSDGVNQNSRILYDRNPRERVEKVAPWLRVDGDAYPAVVDGRVQWIVDAYTTSSSFPYSLHTNLNQATRDTLTARNAVAQQAGDRINYIRNSVKATVDAYDGTVRLYEWDQSDPVLKAWRSAFPGVVQDRASIPPNLVPHLRYPQDLFKTQRTLIGNYHQTDPGQFYSGSDFWEVPEDPSLPTNERANNPQPPYYLPVQMPGQTSPQFSLTTTFVPRNRETPLTALATVSADPASPDYGKIRVAQMPSNTGVPGPEQFVATWENNADVRQRLTLLRTGGAEVKVGNVLTLPVGGGLFYVAPVYVLGTASANPFPLLQKVAVSFGGDQVGFGDNLADAINSVGTTQPTDTGGGDGGGSSPPTSTTSPSPSPTGSSPPSAAATGLAGAIADAQRASRDSDAALKANPPNWTAFGEAQQRLQEALERLDAASTPTPSRSSSARPSG